MQSHRTQLLWQPEDSSVMGMAADEVLRGGSGQDSVKSSKVGGASQQGYMTISRLEKPPEAAYSKASTCSTDAAARSRRRLPALGQRERIRLELLGEMQQLERSSLRQGYTNTTTLKLPAHLAKYISEIWKSSIQ